MSYVNTQALTDIPVVGPEFESNLYIDFLEGAVIAFCLLWTVTCMFYLNLKFPGGFNSLFKFFLQLPRRIKLKFKKTFKLHMPKHLHKSDVRKQDLNTALKQNFDRALTDELTQLIKATVRQVLDFHLDRVKEELQNVIKEAKNPPAYNGYSLKDLLHAWKTNAEEFKTLDQYVHDSLYSFENELKDKTAYLYDRIHNIQKQMFDCHAEINRYGVTVKDCFKTAIIVDKVMPNPGPKSKYNLIAALEAGDFFDLPKIIVTKEDVKIYEMVCFSWVNAFDKDDLYLFGLLWKYYGRLPLKILQRLYSCSRQTIYDRRDRAVNIIENYERLRT